MERSLPLKVESFKVLYPGRLQLRLQILDLDGLIVFQHKYCQKSFIKVGFTFAVFCIDEAATKQN
jgi:hypothetical protein